MDDNRINRRMRPRPYDLRRKVLLKNFLRDQMTHIPGARIESFPQSISVNSSEESSSSDHIDIPAINEHASSSSADGNTQSSSSSSNDDNNNNKHNSELALTNVIHLSDVVDNKTVTNSDAVVNSDNSSCRESSVFKLSDLLKFKKESKNTSKGVSKAKKVCKTVKSSMKTRSFKNSFDRVFYGRRKPHESSTSSQMPRNSPRSLFSMFKYRREQRHAKEVDKNKKSSNNCTTDSSSLTKSNTVNQSVQTDDSWVREEMIKVHQSNKRLKEENKLLSESLSYFMSNSSVDPLSKHCSSPLQSLNKNENSLIFQDYCISSSNNNKDNWNSRSRVSRSKSVHEYNERRNPLRNNYRTRSMNFHSRQNNISAGIRPLVSTYTEVINIPRVRRKNVMGNIPVSISNRGIHRRSSMPERTLSENSRSLYCHRSGSVRNTRKPFHALSADAFY